MLDVMMADFYCGMLGGRDWARAPKGITHQPSDLATSQLNEECNNKGPLFAYG